MKSVVEVCESIWSLEEKYDLLNLELSGVKAWQCARLEIFLSLANSRRTPSTE